MHKISSSIRFLIVNIQFILSIASQQIFNFVPTSMYLQSTRYYQFYYFSAFGALGNHFSTTTKSHLTPTPRRYNISGPVLQNTRQRPIMCSYGLMIITNKWSPHENNLNDVNIRRLDRQNSYSCSRTGQFQSGGNFVSTSKFQLRTTYISLQYITYT